MYPFKYEVSFRVTHPSIDPVRIEDKLGLTAKYSWKAGDKRNKSNGQTLTNLHKYSYCSFRLKHSPKIGLAELLKDCNKDLYKNKRFLKSIRSTGGKLEYFIGWFSNKDSGEVFDLELLEQLVKLGIDLSLAVYGSEKK
jgi:hypothetical protein